MQVYDGLRIGRLVMLCAAAVLAFGPAAPGEAQEAAAERMISVSGTGEVSARPDMATVRIGVGHRAVRAGDAMAATNAAMAQMLDRLSQLGVDPRDVQTTDLSLRQIYAERMGGEALRIEGYAADNVLTVRVRVLERLGEVLDALLSDGANRLDGVTFGLRNPGPLMDEARRRAVADARARATLYAEAAGVGLGKVLTISEGGGFEPRPVMMEMAMARDAGVPVAEGELTLSATVAMRYAISDR